MRTEEEEALHLLIILYRAYRAIEAHAERSISKSGLNATEFAVLELLYHKGSMPLQHIGEKILIASGSITYVVDKLEKKELAVRIQSREDRRITYADLTERGRRFMDDFFPQHGSDIRKAMGALTAEEMSALAEGLKKLGRHARDALS